MVEDPYELNTFVDMYTIVKVKTLKVLGGEKGIALEKLIKFGL